MVGLVIVSHNRKLAEGLVELARQVAPQGARIAFAAGAGTDHQELGTDATEIAEAVRSVWSEAGVLVLMDLGSAILSAELALDLLRQEERQRVRLCPAPLVEGAVAAAAQIAVGADLDTAFQEALKSLLPKQNHLRLPTEQTQPTLSLVSTLSPQEERSVIVRLENPHGLHARPATQLMQTAARFDAQVWVVNLDRPAAAAMAGSLNALLALGALQGHRLQLTARGRQADEVLTALQSLIEEWGRKVPTQVHLPTPPAPDTSATISPDQPSGGAIKGIPIAEGFAVGRLHFFRPTVVDLTAVQAATPHQEWHKLQVAIEKVERDLQIRYEQLITHLSENEAGILQAHKLFLRDPLLLESAHQLIFEEKLSAAMAWKQACEQGVGSLQEMEDAYFRQRVVDMLDVSAQVVAHLVGVLVAPLQLHQPAILVADELTPNQVAEFDTQKVLGVIMVGGGATSHSAILLRGLGIPAVGGVDLSPWGLKDGDWVGIDGEAGWVWLQPSAERRAELEARSRNWKEVRLQLVESAQRLAQTKDGFRVEIAANVGSLAEARLAKQSGAEAIGVLRTEFLYQNRLQPPEEQEQFQVYCQVAELMQSRPVVVRSLDIGGDKCPAYLSLPVETNPYLGLRGIRVSLRYPQLFLSQIRAVLRAAALYPLRLLLPMIATSEELEQSKGFLRQAHQALSEEELAHSYPIPLGIMVETPATVFLAEQLAEQVDFFSIGTNDLTQYTFAAERGNADLTEYSDALHPAILRQIQQVALAAHRCGKPVAVCGEVASQAEALPLLVGLDVDELSMNPNAIPHQKSILTQIDRSTASALAQQALRCDTASQVRELVRDYLAERGVEVGSTQRKS